MRVLLVLLKTHWRGQMALAREFDQKLPTGTGKGYGREAVECQMELTVAYARGGKAMPIERWRSGSDGHNPILHSRSGRADTHLRVVVIQF
jgi:hypothetical protein